MLDPQVLKEKLNNITPEGTVLPEDPAELMTMAQELGVVAEEGVNKMEDVEEFADAQLELAEEGQDLNSSINASVKPFNLSKRAQFPDDFSSQPQIEETPEVQQIEQMEELSQEDRNVVYRARRLERFLTQPFFTTEHLTGMEGKLVNLEETLAGCEDILNDKYMDYDESDLYMIGTIDEADEKRRTRTGKDEN